MDISSDLELFEADMSVNSDSDSTPTSTENSGSDHSILHSFSSNSDSSLSFFDDSDSSSVTSYEHDSDLDVPDLLPAGYPDSDDESDSDEQSNSSIDDDGYMSGFEADVESDWDDVELDVGIESPNTATKLGRFVRSQVEEMYSSRYEAPRTRIRRGPATMRHVLDVLKTERPDHFRQELRVTPYTFDAMLKRISHDPVFYNNSPNQQMPVEDQLAITLYRFGHFGNAAGLDKVSKWSSYGKGTVSLATHRVMTA